MLKGFFRRGRRTWADRSRTILSLELLEDRDLPSGTPASVLLNAPEALALTTADASQQLPRVSVAPDGTTMEVWIRTLETDNEAEQRALPGIRAQFFDASGQKIGTELVVSEALANFTSVAVDHDAQGNFVVAWSENGTSGSQVYVRQYAHNGTALGAQVTVASSTNSSLQHVGAAVDDAGAFVVVWTDTLEITQPNPPNGVVDMGNEIHGQLFSANATPNGAMFTVNSSGVGFRSSPSVDMDWVGNFVVSWDDKASATGTSNVFARRFNGAGAGQGAEFLVNTTTTGNQHFSDVGMDPAGDFVIAWASSGQDGAGEGIFAQRFNASGAPQGGEFGVNTTTQGDQQTPAVAVDSAGGFTIAWVGLGPGDLSGVFAQRYNATGAALGGNFRINQQIDNLKSAPDIGVDSAGNLVAVWAGYGQGSHDFGIVTRRAAASDAAPAAGDPTPVPTPVDLSSVGPVLGDPQGGVAFAMIGDFGYNFFVDWGVQNPVDYVGNMVRSWNPDFILSQGDDNYLLGLNSQFDENVGYNFAPYIVPYVAQTSEGANYPTQWPSTPPQSWNRWFGVPGNHDYHDPFVDGAGGLAGRADYDSWFNQTLVNNPDVTPLAGSYVNTSPYNQYDSNGNPYYDYLAQPINASGQTVPGLANFFMIDSYTSALGLTDGSGPQAQAILADAKSDPNSAAWQFALMHYQPYSSTGTPQDPQGGSIATTQWNFAGNGINAVFSGHVHNYERLSANGIPYVVDGIGGFDTPIDNFSAFGPTLPGSVYRDTSLLYGAMFVTMTPTQVTFQEWRLNLDDLSQGPLLGDSFTLTKSSNVTTPIVTTSNVPTLVATGPGAGGAPDVRVFDARTNALVLQILAYNPSFTGGVRTAVGDVNGDGYPDIITGPGPGGGPDIHVYDGKTGQIVRQFFAFDPAFSDGVFVAAGDLNRDNYADIIVSADAGGGPEVIAFSGKDGHVLQNFFAFDAGFTGGVRVASGDVDGEGHADIIVGAGAGGGPEARVFDGQSGQPFAGALGGFFAYSPSFSGGIYVAAGDVNNDNRADIITGAGVGGGPQLSAFSGADASLLFSFFAFDPNFSGGVRVAAKRINDDGFYDLVAAPGPGGGPQLIKFNGQTRAELDTFFAYDSLFTGGVFAG